MASKYRLFSKITAAAAACAFLFLTAGASRAETTRERVLGEGKIVIGISNGAPWGFRDKNGDPAGFHPDLIKAAFEGLGVGKVEIVVTEFGALIPALTAQRFDAIAAGLYITPERCALVAFSDPDLKLADAALVAEGNPKKIHSYAQIAANPEIKFGVGRGSTTAKNAAAAGLVEQRTQLFPDIQSNVSALLTGRIDVAAFSAPTVARILADENIHGVERALPFQGVQEGGKERFGYSAIAFRKDDGDLRDLYNSRLKALKLDGTVARIMARNGFTDQEKAPDLTSDQVCKGQD
ncbi:MULTISPECIES: ectoine/hydroxyectoine ABC transporter substrate-binding protein EhuB [unclassified Mesorhizobium]|uniref:ectoine/hydroxyectoine ABC transporter substrate-binding protein EhuB n=1 Tax=unclassified Mesorhizobium TaxID=325217 RepID=UPI00112E0543|nr:MULTISPECIES: ectoine/hydroxyectoine ABC transporter substrate-binding protein EhuB [unclassified Mesorhizobium]MBZ9982498.1 ectoine/hydroxyectoine ABC transporter substrate-binding protein EhuB [Mesorhizobium sp. BR-1-1-8]TPL32246.1 ectoine/hydroxyectoine ABC transporter substrate-binding protein EhuB [Mesorhizobium sp. B2-4-8]TPL61175.1 ectoine/hydroxyectoine ABC transporter substrate-binding protein EhuB [Mesorhizobium sp. B2-4-1]